jgi:histidinol-phosphate/aromatic aminotransferase/cobyric acid decarboxylase-like protein
MDLHDYAENKGLSISRVMDFRSGTNPLGPSLRARHAIRKAVKNLSCFPDRQVRHLQRFICKTEGICSENLLFGCGTTQLLAALVRALKPSVVGLPFPVSRHYRLFFESLGVIIRELPVTWKEDHRFGSKGLGPVIEEAEVIFLPYPHDVTGTYPSRDDLAALITDIGKMNKVLVIDEAYLGYTDLPSPVSEVAGSNDAIILRSFSLFHALAGLKIGYALGSRSLLAQIEKGLFGSQVNSFASAAALASLRDDNYRRRTKAFIEKEKAFMAGRIARHEGLIAEDTCCNFILLHFDGTPAGLETLLLDRGILVEEYQGEEGRQFLRVPVRSHKFNARFLRVLGGILKSVKG